MEIRLLKDKKTNWKYLLIVVILAFISGSGILICQRQHFLKKDIGPQVSTSLVMSKKDTEKSEWQEKDLKQNYVFENKYMKVAIPDGWKWKEITVAPIDKYYNQETKEISVKGPPCEIKTGGLELTKNDYILYINLNGQPVSGIGRFGEIAGYMPSAQLIMQGNPFFSPNGPGNKQVRISDKLVRHDLYIAHEGEYSAWTAPKGEKAVAWYGSFVTTEGDLYFGDVNKLRDKKKVEWPQWFVITMGYDWTKHNLLILPEKDADDLKAMLLEMDKIVNSIEAKEIKEPPCYSNWCLDCDYVFSLKYHEKENPKLIFEGNPVNWPVFFPISASPEEKPVLRISLDPSVYYGTNLKDASLTIIVKPGNCSLSSFTETVEINGLTFFKNEHREGTAGHNFIWTSYKTESKGNCYRIFYGLQYYRCEPPLKCYNDDKEILRLLDVLENIIYSFEFIE